MIILKVIHGYPMRFNAGSEVYSQQLCHSLALNHQVHVFTREEDLFKPNYTLHQETDSFNSDIKLHIINMPRFRLNQQYQHTAVDAHFDQLINQIQPSIIHIGHLNHLSTSLIKVAHQNQVPIVFTLHDYWLMCPRGQFIQRNSLKPWALCDGQEDTKCASNCFNSFFSGDSNTQEVETLFWTKWVKQRMQHIREVTSLVDLFIAPSQYLLNRFKNNFSLPEDKLFYLDYGFNLNNLKHRQRVADESFTFGYIGTHIPAKGIQDLIIAFSQLKGNCRLRIWGRERAETSNLKSIIVTLPVEVQARIDWKFEYQNHAIVADVFNHIDALIVPSIWVENSPLVIHEALQVRVPVVTANVGGMAEYIQHGLNGLLFEHRNQVSLAKQMQLLVDNPLYAAQLGAQGYIQSINRDVLCIEQHVTEIEKIYDYLIKKKGRTPHAQTRALAHHL